MTEIKLVFKDEHVIVLIDGKEEATAEAKQEMFDAFGLLLASTFKEAK